MFFIPFVDGPNGLQYVDEYLPEEETVMAMVAERAPKPPRSITVISVSGQVVSMDIVGPFQVRSIQKSSYAAMQMQQELVCPKKQNKKKHKKNKRSKRSFFPKTDKFG